MKIVLLGAPGSGKGTQASLIADKYNLPHISTGDIFRKITKSGTPLGNMIKQLIDEGNMCSDELTVEIVKERLSAEDCVNGFILDGFPRDIKQAEALEKFCKVDIVIDLAIDLSKIERRLTGRRNCALCRKSFHVDHLIDIKTCPHCGGELVVRKDDNLEAIEERLKIFKEVTAPLIGYYQDKGILTVINGDNDVQSVFEEIVKVLGKL